MDSDAKRLLISCVGENDPLFTSEALLLFKSIKKFGGNLVDNSILVANFVKSADPSVKQSLEDMGVQVRIVEPFDIRNPTSNKIRMLEMEDDIDGYGDKYDYDVLVALDCDTAVVKDFSSEINPQYFQALPSEYDLLTIQQWQKLFSYFNLQLPSEIFNTTKRNIIPYFNGGVLSIPRQYVKRLRKSWGEYILRLFEYCHNIWIDELTYQTYFFEELGLSLALKKEKIPLKLLTLEMNFSVQIMNSYFRATGPPGPNLQPNNISPFIVQYHHKYDAQGLIMNTGYKTPDLAIEQVNKIILSSDTNDILTTKKSESEQIPISKDVKVLQKSILGKQKVIEQRERLIKAKDNQLKRAMIDVDILQRINLAHQKDIEEKDAQLKKAIQDVEILQNINIRHQKAIEEKDNKIKSLYGATKANGNF